MICGVVFILFGILSLRAAGSLTTCNDGWVAFHCNCYLFSGRAFSFVEAEHYCQQQGGHLVEVYNDIENAFLKEELRKSKSPYVWIGATDEITDASFIWYSSKNPVNYTDWTKRPSEHTAPDQDCVIFWTDSDYQWADYWCNRHARPLCKQRGSGYTCETSEIVG